MAAIDLNEIRSIVEGRLSNSITVDTPLDQIIDFDLIADFDALGSAAVSVIFHNQPYIPTPNSAWMQCLVSFGNNSFLTMGGTTGSNNSVIGVMVINIFSPKGVGQGANLVIGKRVRDLYNRVIVSGVRFDPPTGPEVVAAPSPEGYFQTQVRMTFETFEDL